MTWILFAALTAVCESLKDVFSKKCLRSQDPVVVAASLTILAVPFLWCFLAVVPIPSLSSAFWLALVSGGLLNTIAVWTYMRALSASDLSITTPMLAFTPLFLLITSPLLVGEVPARSGFAGIILIVAGAYMLNIRQRRLGYLMPVRALFSETGPRLMLAVAFIWSITSNIDKIGVRHSSAIFWSISSYSFIALMMLIVVCVRTNFTYFRRVMKMKLLVLVGMFGALTLIFQMNAINLAIVPYVIAIKRTSVLITVLVGHVAFREEGIRERLPAAVIMLAGVCVICLFQ